MNEPNSEHSPSNLTDTEADARANRGETTSSQTELNVLSKDTPDSCEFHVCTLGASAGGLAPLQEFFSTVADDLGIAFVVIQHLAPDHDSKMPDLLSRCTSMPVEQVSDERDGAPIHPNHVYLIPPGKVMVIQNGRLFLSARDDDEHLTLPIDQFLLSLAQDQGRFGIAVILSGTGGDGSSGVTDIHRNGGLVMAQDPRSCKFDSMPERAIATGLCDVILPPSGLADALGRYVRQSLSREQVDRLELEGNGEPACHRILETLREHSQIDFSVYKPKGVLRRIQRRLELQGFDSFESYSERICSDEDERLALLKDLLIGVTKFYRNKDAFEVLQHEALTKILAGKRDDEEVRIWVAGCATGEEAYSIAFMLDEAIQRLGSDIRFKLFATDAHRIAIDKAALGVFDTDSVKVLPQEKIDKYFIKTTDAYQVIPRIRQQLVFVRHDLMKDAPFTRLDLVSCRNLLIYLQPHAQTKCLALFHFSLSAGGFLFLGSSETVGTLEEEFETINKPWRLFRKLRDVQLAANRAEATRRALAAANLISERMPSQDSSVPQTRLIDRDLQQAYDALLDHVLAAGFLIDQTGRLMHTFSGGSRFLQLAAGRHSHRLTDLIHDDLRPSLGAAIQHCRRDRKKVIYSGISTKLETDKLLSFDIVVEPLSDAEEKHLLVSVTESDTQVDLVEVTRVDVSRGTQDSIQSLENELMFTRENLQATIQELESSNEELQATNEEMVASNEELQSTNEELQSVNEELHTVNAEYHRKIAQLQNATDDMDNLLSSSEVSVLFLDKSLNIRRFTPNLAVLFGLRPQDTGRPITSFQSNLIQNNLVKKFREVLLNRQAVTEELELADGRVFHIRVTPFDSATISDGVVVTYVDTTHLRQKEEEARRSASIVQSTADCIIAIDMAGSITQWNPAAEELYGWPQSDVIGNNFFDLVIPRGERGEMARQIEQIRSDNVSAQFDSVRVTRDGTTLDVMARLSPIHGVSGIVGYSSIERDVTLYRRQTRLRAFEENVQANFFLEHGSGNGLKQLAAIANDAFNPRALWVWRVDGLTGDLMDDFSSFGPGESEWLAANDIRLSDVAIRVLNRRKRIELSVRIAPPQIQNDHQSRRSSGQTEREATSDRWRLLLKPLVYKDQSLGVIGVLVNVISDAFYDEIRSTMLTVARSLAIQIADERHYDDLQRISAIVENAGDLIGTCDAAGRVVSINRAGRLMTGIGLDDDISTLKIKDLHPSESREILTTIGIPEATRSGHWTGETELLDRHGNRIPVSQLITSHRDDSGRVRYLSTICRVMSDQKGVQSRLEKLIQQTQSHSDAKTNFLANVSHDVRTPMTSVIGLAELLLEQELNAEQAEMIRSIRDNGSYVTRLLDDLLDLSRVESGQLAIAPQPVDMRQLIMEIERAFRPNAERAKLDLRVDLHELPQEPLLIDATRVRQIIENLLSNAIKFTETGFVEITTDCEDDWLTLSVRDSGCGIENAMLNSVFDPYTQASPTSSRRMRGAGLGLAISRKLAERMGGELQVSSEPGAGSQFTLRLPLTMAISDLGKTGETLEYPIESRPLAGKRILVAEDTRGIQFLIQRILSRQEAVVTVVENGLQVLEEIKKQASTDQQFDAVILDMQMPVMDGYETARKLRSSGYRLPILALTASTMREQQAASLDAGCDRFLPKPIDQAELLTVIWQLIR